MKILNLYFKNINSLEGESRIHFDKAPIVDGGVFAITGPNGSGKSSVLDAITLGLYGETYRFDHPAEHVMTKSTTESFSEVEFELSGNNYKTSWYVKRKDGNTTAELLQPEMKLVLLNDGKQVLADTTQKVHDRMIELTGMDFHKFSKSMVLAQGDFASFLNALDSERMDILEKISGTDIYQDYTRQAEEKYSQAQTQLQQLEQDLTATPVMDKVTKEAREHDLADFKEQQVELEAEQKEVQQQLAWVQNIVSLEKQAENLSKQQQQLQIQQDSNQQNLEKIEASKDLLDFEDELTTLDNKVESVQESKKTLDNYRDEVGMLQKQLKSSYFDENAAVTTQSLSEQKESIDQLALTLSELKSSLPRENALLQTLEQQKNQKNAVFNTCKTWLQEHAPDKTLLEKFPDTEKLLQLRSELAVATEKQTSHSKQNKNATTALAKKKSDVKATNTKINQLKELVKEHEKTIQELSEGHSLQELQSLQTEQQGRVVNFQELFDLATVNAKLGKKSLFSGLFGSKAIKEEKQLNEEHNHLQLEIGKEKLLVTTLEAAVSNEALLKKMALDRQQLVDGKACPLCGALEHPFAKHTPAVSNSKQVLKEQKNKLKTLVAVEVRLKKKMVSAQQQAKRDDQKEDKLQNVISQWNALANRLNALSVDMDIDNLSLMKSLLKTEKKELSHITSILKQTIKLQKAIMQSNESIATNTASLTRETKESEKLSAEWDSRPKESVESEQAFKQSVEQEKILSAKVKQQLEQLGEKMPKAGKEALLFKSLNNRKREYQRQSLQHQALLEEIKKLDEQISTGSEKIKTLEQSIQQASDNVQQGELVGVHLSLIEKQKMIAEKELAFTQQESELATLKQTLNDKTKAATTGNLTTLRDSITAIQHLPEMQQKQQKLNTAATALENNKKDVQAQLEAEQAISLTEKTEYDLTGLQSVIKRKLDITKQEVISLQNKLDKQGSMQQKQDAILTKIAAQKLLFEASEAEKKITSEENNINFRKKVQKDISDKLMTETNQILEKISGRYYLRSVESEHGLALEIEDTKQHNVRRLPKTLSGGESFIVSLGLALGLAEMSNNGQAVDSLFLDEGFGNLDAESLYLAMTTLESLQTHGKVVGVISHIEGVHKRIKTQIEMIKKPNGFSALKVVS